MSRAREHAVNELLVLRCQDGSTEAFEKLVRRWQRPLWRYAIGLTGRTDAAWEVVQEAWLGIVRGIHRLRDPALFAPWAFRIVRNRASTLLKRVQRDRGKMHDVDLSRVEAEERGSEGGEVRTALARLQGDLRSVLTGVEPRAPKWLAMLSRIVANGALAGR